MIIKSNTVGKLNKIINGTVFSNELMFVREFLQNTQRAKATNVSVEVDDFFIRISDDGKGCKKPSNIFTLDLSEWESTNEGFGIGFWSCLAFKGLKSVEVRSFDWKGEILIQDILNGNLEVTMHGLSDSYNGFEIILNTEYLDFAKREKIRLEVCSVAQYLDFKTEYNGNIINKIDIFNNVDGEFVKMIDNRIFKAKLSISKRNYKSIELFYDKREVCPLYNLGYIEGIIEPKKGKITLKEPDRAGCIYDDKYYDLRDLIEKEAKKIYIDFLKSNPEQSIINEYSESIDFHLDVKDYERYIDFNHLVDNFESKSESESESEFELDIDAKVENYNVSDYVPHMNELKVLLEPSTSKDAEQDIKTINLSSNSDYIDSSHDALIPDISMNTVSKETTCALDQCDNCFNETAVTETDENSHNQSISVKDISDCFSVDDHVVHNHTVDCDYFSDNDEVFNVPDKKSKEFKKHLKIKKNLVWVLKEDVDMYKDELAHAEYCNLCVVKLDNILYSNILKKYNKMHISEFKDCFKKTFNFKNVFLKNAKEERVIENLIPICKKYNLPLNTFVIGNIETYSKLDYNGKTIFSEKSKNSKGNISVYAVINNGTIILDRTALDLARFKVQPNTPFGINDLRLIFAISETIVHELAHLLYQTQDNTVEHYKAEIIIREQITKLYI